jgi:hypothetical protein
MRPAAILIAFTFALQLVLFAQQNAPASLPAFEDYPNTEVWKGPNAPAKIVSRAERMFRTRLRDAARQKPNFAGHYYFTTWGCGSNCMQGAMVDLRTGDLIQSPFGEKGDAGHWTLCESCFDDEDDQIEFRAKSDLLIIRCGLNWDDRTNKNRPDVYYFLWRDNNWKELLHLQPPRAR